MSAIPGALFDGLEHILRSQLDGHQRLLKCIERKRQAIRTADITSVTSICSDENAVLLRLTELEKHRLELLGHLTQMTNPKASVPLTLNEIAQTADEPQQSRMLALAAQLREALEQVKRQSSIVRAAADALARHMSGIVQTVHSALSRARIYGHRGNIALGAQLQSIVDLKS